MKFFTAAPKTYSTAEAAARAGVREQTLRSALSLKGHYCGITPTKRFNRFLAWPADQIDALADRAKIGVVFPPFGPHCGACAAAIPIAEMRSGASPYVVVAGGGRAAVGVGICPRCVDRAVAKDGGLDALCAEIAAAWPDGVPLSREGGSSDR